MSEKMIIPAERPTSVGEMLVEEFLEPMAMSNYNLADTMGVSQETIDELCTGRRSITKDIAVRLSDVLGTSPDFWMNLQNLNDLWEAKS